MATRAIQGPSGAPLWGPLNNPLAGFVISALWHSFPEGTYVKNSVFSSLSPDSAHIWSVQCSWHSTLEDMMPLAASLRALLTLAEKVKKGVGSMLIDYSALDADSEGGLQDGFGNDYDYALRNVPAARAAAVVGSALGRVASTIVDAAGASNQNKKYHLNACAIELVAEVFSLDMDVDSERRKFSSRQQTKATTPSTYAAPSMITRSDSVSSSPGNKDFGYLFRDIAPEWLTPKLQKNILRVLRKLISGSEKSSVVNVRELLLKH